MKRWRKVVAKSGQLLIRWGRGEARDLELVYAYGGEGANKRDANMLIDTFAFRATASGLTLLKELESRGFDLTTLRFTIERKASA